MKLEIDLALEAAFFQKDFGNSDSLGVADLDNLAFHNYIVITGGCRVNTHKNFTQRRKERKIKPTLIGRNLGETVRIGPKNLR
jgi:hypothetical protein